MSRESGGTVSPDRFRHWSSPPHSGDEIQGENSIAGEVPAPSRPGNALVIRMLPFRPGGPPRQLGTWRETIRGTPCDRLS